MTDARFLPDVNVLIAMTDRGHEGFAAASQWFEQRGQSEWLLCPLTESGFLRLAAQPDVGGRKLRDAVFLLMELVRLPGYRYCPISEPWLTLTRPFLRRLQGYRQVTGAYLLGLAMKESAVLVTLDRRIELWAAPDFSRNLLTLR